MTGTRSSEETVAAGGRLLIVDDEAIALANLQHVMAKEGYQVTATDSGSKALALLQKQRFDVVLTDLRMEKVDGMAVLDQARMLDPYVEVIMITGYATAESAVKAMKQGAFYYIAKPFRLEEARKVVSEAMAKVHLRRENDALRQQLQSYQGPLQIITQDKEMQRLLDLARQVAPTDCNMLICGDSGTGKELFARYLHHQSNRRDGPYIAVNCGAFSEQLLANELFGHEKGAFTGATTLKKGLFEAATGGTLFLDEITEMPLAMQVKLLRVLQEREVLRLGATKPVRCDVRVITATNADIAGLVRGGKFRQDLYFRINVVTLRLPRLAQRRGDIPLLAQHFLQKHAARMKRPVTHIARDAMALLSRHDFPGNVRELENIIESATAVGNGDALEVGQLPDHLQDVGIITFQKKSGRLPTLDEQEHEYIRRVLDEVAGNQTAAAQILGINRASLWRKLKRNQV
jgi:DNA-binding NtrC family response regulator